MDNTVLPNAPYADDGEERDWNPDMYMKFWKDFLVFPSLLSKSELAKVFLSTLTLSLSIFLLRPFSRGSRAMRSSYQIWKLANVGDQSDGNPFELSYDEFTETVARVAMHAYTTGPQGKKHAGKYPAEKVCFVLVVLTCLSLLLDFVTHQTAVGWRCLFCRSTCSSRTSTSRTRGYQARFVDSALVLCA